MSQERKFNFIYSKVVADNNDLIGHIAYSLYKNQKVQFITSFREQNEGRLPNEAELEPFHQASLTTISANKAQAEQILSTFMDNILNERIAEIEANTLLNQQKILEDIIDPLKPKSPWSASTFWMGVLQKGAQTLVLAIIIFLIIFITDAATNGNFWSAVSKWIPKSEKTTQNSH